MLIVITWVGALTAFFAATTGLLQNDIKRVIAYSTCSQLGYMVMACGLSQYNVALFHLVNHAFFKALLFLAAGSIIHAFADQQDMRKLGGLINFLPFTYTMILIGSLSLMAIPFLTGFYSKDLILELAYAQYQLHGYIAYWLGTISAVFTAYYSLRLISYTFYTYPNGAVKNYLNIHEAPLIMCIPLIILAIMSIMFGYITKDIFVGIGTDFLSYTLFTHPNHISHVDAEFSIGLLYKLLPAIGTIVGASLALVMYHSIPEQTVKLTNTTTGYYLYRFFNQKYFFDIVINNYIISKSLTLGYITFKIFDKGIIETIGPYGIENMLSNTSNSIALFDTGLVTQYALYIALGLITLIFIIFTPILLFYNNIFIEYDNIRYIILYISCSILLLTTTVTNRKISVS